MWYYLYPIKLFFTYGNWSKIPKNVYFLENRTRRLPGANLPVIDLPPSYEEYTNYEQVAPKATSNSTEPPPTHFEPPTYRESVDN